MKKPLRFALQLLVAITVSLLLYGSTACCQQTLIGHFYGRTPCQELAAFFKVPVTADCIKIKWHLALYAPAPGSDSGLYMLEGFRFRGNSTLKGWWKASKGSQADANAMVYTLYHAQQRPLHFLKASEDVMIFVDAGKRILPGNRYFSYVLYKEDTIKVER